MCGCLRRTDRRFAGAVAEVAMDAPLDRQRILQNLKERVKDGSFLILLAATLVVMAAITG